jgi:hypothetical protein
VLTANGDDLTDTSDPLRVMMRQIAARSRSYEKTRLVSCVAPASACERSRGNARAASPTPSARRSWCWRRSACIVAPPRATADRSARAAVFGLSSVDLLGIAGSP